MYVIVIVVFICLVICIACTWRLCKKAKPNSDKEVVERRPDSAARRFNAQNKPRYDASLNKDILPAKPAEPAQAVKANEPDKKAKGEPSRDSRNRRKEKQKKNPKKAGKSQQNAA